MWVFMEIYGGLYVSMEIYGCLLKSMGVYGSLGKIWECECSWVPMGVYVCDYGYMQHFWKKQTMENAALSHS